MTDDKWWSDCLCPVWSWGLLFMWRNTKDLRYFQGSKHSFSFISAAAGLEPNGGHGRAQLVQSCQENVVNMIWDDPIDYETNCKFSKDLLLLLDLVKRSGLFSFVSFKDEKKQNQLTTNSLGKFLLKNELKIVKTKCFWLVIRKIIKLILMRHCDY